MQRILIFFTVLLAVASLSGQTVEVWTTGGVTSERLQRWNDVTFTGDGISNASTITVQPWKKYQAIDGFGYTLTQGSAKVLRGLKDWKRKQVLRDLFGPDGIGLSVVRIGIGATDLSESAYTYNDQGPDPQLNGFSLAGPDLRDLVPVLREIVAINPQIKVLATPWTAPKWMKTNNSYRGGNLKPQYMEVYATYFLRYLEAMKAQGISIWAITPQNEPGHGGNVPSMEMSEAQQLAFVDRYLGPKLAASRFDPLIIGYDHNCDEPSIPINLLNGSDYFDGAAFHLYAGNIGAMSQVHAATGKGVYFTEQYTGAAGSFNGDFGWHMENIVIGSLNNWSRTVLEWNLAADATQGPHTSGGCTDCLPALTISGGNATPNVAYYIIAQIAKFVPPGSVRLGATSRSGNLLTTAFQRPDGKRVVLVYNRSSNSSTVRIKDGGRSFDQYIHGRSAITFVWNSGGPALRQIAGQAETAAQGVHIFPNPADSELRAELDPDAGYDRLWLLDPLGRVLQEEAIKPFETVLRLDVATLPPGAYWIRLRGTSGTVASPFSKQ